MQSLYPAIKPYGQHELVVDAPHRLYIEECGSQDGLPILFVHGGPGAGCTSEDRRFFDPEKYRIILVDQRGSGRSTPYASIEHNHTQALVDDLERVRSFLKIDQWALFGGSWGATLSLLYAQQYPEHVLALILRGIFLGTSEELQWFYQEGANRIFPDYWQNFIQGIPLGERENLLAAYSRRLFGEDQIAQTAAAKAWSEWEGYCATLAPSKSCQERFTNLHFAKALARIETHYFMANCFLSPRQILDNVAKIAHLPGIIVHGRYDLICPLEKAYQLHQAWPGSELHLVRDAGHSAYEPGIMCALVHATNNLLYRFR